MAFSIGLATLLQVLPCHARGFTKSTLDYTLLTADSIVFATVSSIEAVAEGLIDVGFTHVRTVGSRWAESNTLSIRVRAYFKDGGCVRPVRHEPTFCVGGRYLMFLRGGAFDVAPVLNSTRSIYEVSHDGFVVCPGGVVFGVSPGGLACSTRENEVASPPSEIALGVLLRASLSDARARRPKFAAQRDQDAQPLSFPVN